AAMKTERARTDCRIRQVTKISPPNIRNTAMPLIKIHALTKEYKKGDQTIAPLQDVSLAIDKGDFVSLMGASGSGKSTLLNLIAGIDKPSAGTIHVAGTDITKLSRTQLAHWRASHVGYIFQLYNLIPVLTAYEN